MCEAAQTAKRDPDFAPGYEALARRRGRKIATTAIARKLLTRAYHLLTDAGTRQRQARSSSPAPCRRNRLRALQLDPGPRDGTNRQRRGKPQQQSPPPTRRPAIRVTGSIQHCLLTN
jgi:hypothetical protein